MARTVASYKRKLYAGGAGRALARAGISGGMAFMRGGPYAAAGAALGSIARSAHDSLTEGDGPNQTVGKYSQGRLTWKAKKLTRARKASYHRSLQRALHIQLKEANPQSWQRTTTTGGITLAGQQTIVFLPPLLSYNGTNGSYDDLVDLSASMLMSATGQTWPAQSLINHRLAILKAYQEVQLTNVETVNKVYLNIYKYYVRKLVDQPAPNSMFVTPLNWATGTAIGTTTYGSTPFDYKEVVDKVKFVSKEEYQLGAGESLQLTMHSNKLRIFNGMQTDGVTANSQFGLPGFTMGYCIHSYGAPGLTNSTSEATNWYSVTTNKYICKVLPNVVSTSTASVLT